MFQVYYSPNRIFLEVTAIILLMIFRLDNLKMVHPERSIWFRASELHLHAQDYASRCQLKAISLSHQFSSKW